MAAFTQRIIEIIFEVRVEKNVKIMKLGIDNDGIECDGRQAHPGCMLKTKK